ncbi:MAG TPA: hypothetical protein VK425_07110 [Acidimicrobiales bacterium]|nr:hypothetical protein [Acidimicrobiales bacterium]
MSTSQPGLVDLTATSRPSSAARGASLEGNGQGDAGGTAYETSSIDGEASFEWAWPADAELPRPTRATALRVSVKTSGTAEIAYVNAIGTRP